MWNVSSAAIPGPWPALPAVAPWMAGAAAAAVLIGLAFVIIIQSAGRTRSRERPADARVRHLHGVRAA